MLTFSQRLTTFLLLITLFACRTEAPKSKALDRVNVRLFNDPLKINPVFTSRSSAREIFQYIYLPLADFHPTTKELVPILIEKIPDEELITEGPLKGNVAFDFRIKDEARWTDGSPVTAEDYAFTVKSIMLPNSNTPSWKPLLVHIKDVMLDPSDDKHVRVVVDGDYMLAREIVLTIYILPESIHDPHGLLQDITLTDIHADQGQMVNDSTLQRFASYFNSPVVSRDSVQNNGPYVLTSWVTNQSLVLERKPNYWGAGSENPFLQAGSEKLIFKIIPDENTALTALKNKDIDIMTFRNSANFRDLQKDQLYQSDFNYFTPNRYIYYYLALNNRREILSDPQVRLALSHLTNVELLIDTIENGFGSRTIGHFNPAKPYYATDIEPINFDLEKAKSLLEQAGWKDTNNNGIRDKLINGELKELELELLVTGSNLTTNIGILFKDAASRAEIGIRLNSKKNSVMRKENIAPRNYDIATLAISQSVAPDDPFTRWHSSMDVSGGNNVTGYRNPKADALMEQIRNEKNDTKRNNLYKELQLLMFKDQPAIFLYSPQSMIAINKDLEATASSKRPGYFANTFKQKVSI